MPNQPDCCGPGLYATQGRILAIAWPVMLSNITVPLLGLVDSAILGHLPDARHLGAVAIGAQLFTLLCWSFGFLRMGTTAACARSQNAEQIQASLQQGLWLALGLVLLVLPLGLLVLPQILPLMGASAGVESGASAYLLIRCLSIPAVLLQYVLMGWFIGRSETRVPLLVMTITNLANAALDYSFVFGLGMTANGVALGSVLADYTGLASSLWFARRAGLPGAWLNWQQRPGWLQLRPLIRVNRDLFIRTLLLLSVLTLFQAAGARQDDLILATNSLLMTLLMLISNALDGFAHAAESLTGQALARRHQTNTRQIIILTGVNSFLMAVSLTLAFALFGQHLWPLLTSNTLLLPILDEYQDFLLWLPVTGFASFWLDGLCIGAGATAIMRRAMLGSALVFVLLWQGLGEFGNSGLWLALYGFFLCRAVAALPFLWNLYQTPNTWAPDF
jgi:multidrug resistance protein, MATE family